MLHFDRRTSAKGPEQVPSEHWDAFRCPLRNSECEYRPNTLHSKIWFDMFGRRSANQEADSSFDPIMIAGHPVCFKF